MEFLRENIFAKNQIKKEFVLKTTEYLKNYSIALMIKGK